MAQTFAVVIPYFNPVGYRSHPRKLAETLDAFRRIGLADHVFLAGAGPRPAVAANVAFWDEHCDVLWHKERLVNMAAVRLAERYSHIAWVDSDVLVGADWPAAMTEAFEQARVVQCFRAAHYLSGHGTVSRTRTAAMLPGGNGAIGLAWGACRSLFTDGPGLFDLGLVGGGDSVFALGVLRQTATPSVPWLPIHRDRLGLAWSPRLLAALDDWTERAAAWHGSAAAVAARAEVQIIEHGSVTQRSYNDRHHLLAGLDPQVHLTALPGRAHRWSETGLGEVEAGVRAYFHERQEDDDLIADDESAA
jgi:hypothetical protein